MPQGRNHMNNVTHFFIYKGKQQTISYISSSESSEIYTKSKGVTVFKC